MEIPVDQWGDRPEDYVPPGGWLRAAWNYCWKRGLSLPFPHTADALDELRRELRSHLAERGAPAYKLEALADWGVEQYNDKRRRRSRPQPSLEERTKMLGRPPIRPRPYLLIPELPPMMRRPNARGRFRPLVQYAKDWAEQPAHRDKMMADRPPPDTELAIALSIAAVVHALCDMSVFTDPRRTAFVVDTINTWLPPHLQQALDEIAQRESLTEDWFNNKVVNTMPSEGVDYQPRMAYRGEKFGVYHPSLEKLLAMKLKSSRLDKDLLDAARLADETGISRVRDLTTLVEDTYGPGQITPRVEDFIDSTVERYIKLRLATGRTTL